MSLSNNYLSFEVVENNSCKLITLLDTSIYQDEDSASGFVLQVKIPGGFPDVELNYYKKAITMLNSNTLGLTNVNAPTYYQNLPDGLYTAKISICPFEDNWFQKSWYRTCQLECKYYKAFLNLELNKCTTCFNKQKAEQLNTVYMYIQGIHANVTDCNFKAATDLYSVANKLVDLLLNCDDCKPSNLTNSGCCK